MPQYQPPQSDTHVISVEAAIKDGILGPTTIPSLAAGLGPLAASNLDLKKLISDLDDDDDIPSVFICPISLSPMTDPVTLSTGQTYDRPNILKWFSFGNLTCPTTMQDLWDDTLTPNHTLQQLIHAWCSHKYLTLKKKAEDVNGRSVDLIESLRKAKGKANKVKILSSLRNLVSAHPSTRRTVASCNGVQLICGLLGPFTSHAVGAEAVGVLVNLSLDKETRGTLMQPEKVSLVVDLLSEGSIETKVNCVRLLEVLMGEKDFRVEVVSSLSLVAGVLRLVKDRRYPNGVLAGIGILRSICSYEKVRGLVVSVGAVAQIVELLPELSSECLEPALQVLDYLSSVKEGQVALRECEQTIPNVVRLLMRVSEACTKCSLSVLSAVCSLDPGECGRSAVEAGLAAKLLLVIQSGSDQALKQRASELLKLCSLNYTPSHFISKCKLTRTMQ